MIYVDKLERLYKKFNIEKNLDANTKEIFFSGIINLRKYTINFDDFFLDEEISEENKDSIENTLNAILFKDGYLSFFNFAKLRDCLQSIL